MAIKTAVVGAGLMGNEHLRRLQTIPDVQVVAVVDPFEESARATAERHQVPASYADVPAMLAAERPDYVVIASPPRYHAAQAAAAYEAGAHVLIEKPLCMNNEEAERIQDAAQKAGRLFTMGLQRRQIRAMRALKGFLAEGKLGQIYHTRVWGGHEMNYPWGRYFHKKAESMGGVIAATIVHILDAAIWVLGAPEPVTVSASMFRRLDKMPDPPINFVGTIDEVTVEDFAHAHVRFADGASMSIEGNWLMHPSTRATGFEIHGVLGIAREKEACVELERQREIIPVNLEYDVEPEDAIRQEHVEFVAAIRGESLPLVTFREALIVQRIMVGIYESAERGVEVRV